MRRFGFAIVLSCLFLVGCTPALTVTPSATDSPAPENSSTRSTPSVVPSRTVLASATATIPASTPQIKPSKVGNTPINIVLSTIATFTPTFDVRTIVTATPAPKAECPQEAPNVKVDILGLYDADWDAAVDAARQRGEFISDLLNQGLLLEKLFTDLKSKNFEYQYIDLTGDGVKDVFLLDLGRFHVLYCDAGQYRYFTQSDFYAQWTPDVEITDLNKNGLPELLSRDGVMNKRGVLVFKLDEWNGETFVDIMLDPETEMDPEIAAPENAEFQDVNQDGLKELVLTGEGAWDEDLQARVKTSIYAWNGKFYAETYTRYAPPQYRYQAVQDGDREILYGNYQKALAFYQEAIFSDELEWWSPELGEYKSDTYYTSYDPTPIIYPTPIPNQTEYPRLAAYAYYRMIILHTYLCEIDSAQVKYATLQEKFPAENPGYPYTEMATDFWNAFQSSGKMYNACAAAIAYADAHPEILDVLNGHGYQSIYYGPADVCPFR